MENPGWGDETPRRTRDRRKHHEKFSVAAAVASAGASAADAVTVPSGAGSALFLQPPMATNGIRTKTNRAVQFIRLPFLTGTPTPGSLALRLAPATSSLGGRRRFAAVRVTGPAAGSPRCGKRAGSGGESLVEAPQEVSRPRVRPPRARGNLLEAVGREAGGAGILRRVRRRERRSPRSRRAAVLRNGDGRE